MLAPNYLSITVLKFEYDLGVIRGARLGKAGPHKKVLAGAPHTASKEALPDAVWGGRLEMLLLRVG